MARKYSDLELIEDLKRGGVSRERASSYLYDNNQGFIFKMIKDKGLGLEEARDAYVDAVIAVSEQVSHGKFRGDSRLSTYLFQIFRFKCIDALRRRGSYKEDPTSEVPETADPAQDALQRLGLTDQVGKVSQMMEQVGSKCKGILLDWAYYGYNMEEIATRHELKDASSASTQKYKCFKRLQTLLQSSRLATD